MLKPSNYLPRSINDPIFWLRVALVFVAEFAFVRGWRYTFEREPVPMALELITSGFSITVYGVLWFAASGWALISIPKVWPSGAFPSAVLALVFAFGFTLSWISSWTQQLGTPGRADYVSASTYWIVSGLIVAGYFLSRAAIPKGSLSPRQG